MLEKANSKAGRHPVWICILFGLLLGQMFQLIAILTGFPITGFSGSIPGWQAILYNVLGGICTSAILLGILRQGPFVPIGKFVSALLIEQYASLSLAFVVLVYSVHSIARPGTSFPFILIFLAIGLVCQAWRIRVELKEIQADMAYVAKLNAKQKAPINE